MIKFGDTRILDKVTKELVDSILVSGQFINGIYNKKFSDLWSEECGAKYCITTASGMASLITCLKSVKINNSSRHVVVPNLSFAATAFAVVEAGLIPIYCPVKENGLLNQDVCLKIINSFDVLAVIPVYLYGQWFEIYPEILERVYVVEDACQAHGVVKRVQGEAACFSFYPSKNLGAAGDAGAIVTGKEEIKDYCEKYINYGDTPGEKYSHEIVGNNLRMDEIQAAILSEKIKFLREDRIHRMKLATRYMAMGIDSYVNLDNNSYHLYPILRKSRDIIRQNLKEIETGNHYPYKLSDVCRGETDFLKNDFADKISTEVLTLPIGKHISEDDVVTIAAQIQF